MSTLIAIIVIGFPVTLGLAYLAGHANILFTLVREGTAKGVVRAGRLHKFLMSYNDFRINDPWSLFYTSGEPPWKVMKKKFAFDLGDLRFWRNLIWLIATLPVQLWLKGFEYFGVYFVGPIPFLYSVYVRENWKWNEWERDDKTGVYVLKPRVGSTDFIYVNKFTYGFILRDAEAKGGMPMTVVYAVTVETDNPDKALFKGGDDWLDRATVLFHDRVRQFTANHEPNELLEKAKTDAESFQTYMLELNTALPGVTVSTTTPASARGFLGERGIRVTDARIDSFNPTGTDEQQAEYRRIWLTKHIAEQDAAAVVITAEGKAKATIIEAEAQGKAYDTVIQRGQEGMTLATLAAMEKSGQTGNTVVWANSPLGNIGNLFKNIGEKKD